MPIVVQPKIQGVVGSGVGNSGTIDGSSNASTTAAGNSVGDATGGASGLADAGDTLNKAIIGAGDGDGGTASLTLTGTGGNGTGGSAIGTSSGRADRHGDPEWIRGRCDPSPVQYQNGGSAGLGGASTIDFVQDVDVTFDPTGEMSLDQENFAPFYDAVASPYSMRGDINDLNTFTVDQLNLVAGGPQVDVSMTPNLEVGDVSSYGGVGGIGGNAGTVSASIGDVYIGGVDAVANSGDASAGSANGTSTGGTSDIGNTTSNGGNGGNASKRSNGRRSDLKCGW